LSLGTNAVFLKIALDALFNRLISLDLFAVEGHTFYLRHQELMSLVVAAESRLPPTPGLSLVAHYSYDRRTGALMFREDPQTRNIVTVDGGLCITDRNGIIRCD